jgi:hypothetical protein
MATQLLDIGAAAEYLNVTPSCLHDWRDQGRGPVYVKLGRLVRYRIRDLDAFVRSGRILISDRRKREARAASPTP